MNSIITDDFVSCFARLPETIREQARRAYRIWRKNPNHPSLRFKPIRGWDNLYSVRIGRQWRALGFLEDQTITWFWIGSHADYEEMIR